MSERIKECLLLAASWLFAVVYTYTNFFADLDLWGRLSMGALFFQNGRFPYRDVFSYTAFHAPWVDHEWLTGLIFYQVLSCFGEAGFLAFKYLLILGIFALLFRLHRKVYKVSSLYTFYALLVLIDAYSIGLYATVRSHIFSFLFFMVALYLLERVRVGQKDKHVLWWLLPLLLLWGNLHGGVIMGFLLLGCYGLGEVIQHRNLKAGLFHWFLAGTSCLLLALVNPYGPAYLSFLWHAWTLDRSKISEWAPLRLDGWLLPTAQLMFLLGTIVPLARWWFSDKTDAQESQSLVTPTIVLLWIIVMMLRAVRIQPFTAFVIVAYLPVFLNPAFVQRLVPANWQRFFQEKRMTFCTVIPFGFLILMASMAVSLQSTINLFKVPMDDEMSRDKRVEVRYPLGALSYLKESPYHGNLMLNFGLGEFMLWALYPRFKVSIDGRYEEVYSQRQFLENQTCHNKWEHTQNWNSLPIINQSQADFLLMQSDTPVNARLAQSPLWTILYTDAFYTLFGRTAVVKRFPAYKRPEMFINPKLSSIGDFFTPADLKRFKTKEY